MSDDPRPGPMVPSGTRDETDYGRMTHIERTNAGDNPADGTGAVGSPAPGAPPKPDDESKFGPRRPYRLLAAAFDGVRLAAGEIVWLFDHQVGAHHQRLTDDGREIEYDPRGGALKHGGDRIVLGAAGTAVTAQPAPTARLPLDTGETEMSPEQFNHLMAVLEPIAECSRRVLAQMDHGDASVAALEAQRIQREHDEAAAAAATAAAAKAAPAPKDESV